MILRRWFNALVSLWCHVFGHHPVETSAYFHDAERRIVWCTICHMWYEVEDE